MTARPPVWVVELATRFWAAVPEPPPPFPRDLSTSLAWLPHIQVVALPHLTLAGAVAFLERMGRPFSLQLSDRPLRGCLAASHGSAVVLLDAADGEAEQRLTLAHELAHFLRDYDEPRRRAVARLGSVVLEVFDGRRQPTTDEQLAGVLRRVTVGCHTHLLDRDDRGRPQSPAIHDAEEAADRLAFELLAPFDAIATLNATNRESLAGLLTSTFGFPPSAAAKYARLLLSSQFS